MRFPLRCTLLATVALLVLPLWALSRLPRPRAEGLGRLLPHAALLQSFPASAQRQPPQLWQQRLPAASARALWQQQRQLWWQLWGRDGAGGAYLVLPLPRPLRTGALPRPPHSLEVDGLLVVAANPLAERLLRDQLKTAPRPQRGLQQRCLAQLQARQSAFWSADGLAAMAGPLAPLFLTLQEGCIDLTLDRGGVSFAGEAAAIAGLVAPMGPAPVEWGAPPAPLDSSLLLQASGRALEPLLRGLLARQLIREPLVTAYGLSDDDLRLLQGSGFLLRLRPQASGPFQAGLELVLAVPGPRQRWDRMLEGIADRLVAGGLVPNPSQPGSWQDGEGRQVGGWRWLTPSPNHTLLQLYLGPDPRPLSGPWTQPLAWRRLQPLQLQARPSALARLGLLPEMLPRPLLQADQFAAVAGPFERRDSAPSRLQGRLELPAR